MGPSPACEKEEKADLLMMKIADDCWENNKKKMIKKWKSSSFFNWQPKWGKRKKKDWGLSRDDDAPNQALMMEKMLMTIDNASSDEREQLGVK